MASQSAVKSDNVFTISVFIAILIGLLYGFTYSFVPTSDAPTWLKAVQDQDWRMIFIPTHLLPLSIMMLVQKFLQLFHSAISILAVINSVNAIISALIVIAFYRLAAQVGLEPLMRITGAALFGVSYGLWYFSNGELHHFGILTVLALFSELIRYRLKPSAFLAIRIAILHVLAVLFHQEHAFMLIPISWMMLYKIKNQNVIKNFLLYLVCALIAGASVVALVGSFVNQSHDLEKIIKWFFYIYDKGLSSEGYVLLRWHDWSIFRAVKGMLMALHYGSQIIVDVLRYAELRLIPHVVLFSAATVCAFLILTAGIIRFFLKFLASKDLKLKSVWGGLLIWFLCYKILFNLTYMPESPEYHISSNIPLLLFFCAGLSQLGGQKIKIVLASLILLCTFSVNLFASILPWKAFGGMLRGFEHTVFEQFKSGDYFISSESCLDNAIDRNWKRLSIKWLFIHKAPEESLRAIESAIEENLANNNRVFIYNFIPSLYALKAMNFYNKGNQFTKKYFQDYFSILKLRYDVIPVFTYWEETDSRHYLFDRHKDTLWEIRKK